MNVYLADSIARQHADDLLADAAAARRLRRARARTRVSATSRPSGDSARQPAASSPLPGAARAGAAVAHFVLRPFTAAHTWLAAGEL